MVSRISPDQKKRGDKNKRAFSFLRGKNFFFGFSQIIFRGFYTAVRLSTFPTYINFPSLPLSNYSEMRQCICMSCEREMAVGGRRVI